MSDHRCFDWLAWAVFAIGAVLMFGVAFNSLLTESDGRFRVWEEVQYHRNCLFAAAGLAFVGPAAACGASALLAWLGRRLSRKPTGKGSPGYSDF
jgi:hypothetical protein